MLKAYRFKKNNAKPQSMAALPWILWLGFADALPWME
jgi:hypothetical protein